MPKLHKNVRVAFAQLSEGRGLLCRQFSRSDDATHRGENYLYFRVMDGKKIGTASAKFLIQEGLVKPCSDGLFEDTPQTFRTVSPDEFDDFKERYEAV
ncbi:hypothetical protein [Pseudohoeflea coraliihabitans]|uniref:Uncharacterized protein n=1 Tax=Pseudohoeflea coraliihabitans TaxID=2860393 RepID=A0ABS6WI89_9HYPH|nr:hypothetical protein [Pseudohoeflea sp. DP4N28-3]MBW3095661.1 hypothetical protein [Pseudohoeflea sp. DP4N28-3]